MRSTLPVSVVAPDHPDFIDLNAIQKDILGRVGGSMSSFEAKLGAILRQAIDWVIETPKTGRRSCEELEKTEKTYLGTRVEIELRALLKLPRGRLDLVIDGRDVDVKFTIGNNWMIPTEAVNAFCLLVAADELRERCYCGLIKAKPEYLTSGGNRDLKKTITAQSFENILWIVNGSQYPANFWKSVDPDLIQRIFVGEGGTERLVTLFSSVCNQPISRSVVADVARQDDYMKRLRTNGGARDALGRAGIVLLSGKYDSGLIASLRLPTCTNQEFISTRLDTAVQKQMAASHGHVI